MCDSGHGVDAVYAPYNDGPVGTVMGSMPQHTFYKYDILASPTGTTWYHGHVKTTLTAGNRGPIIFRKHPYADPYA